MDDMCDLDEIAAFLDEDSDSDLDITENDIKKEELSPLTVKKNGENVSTKPNEKQDTGTDEVIRLKAELEALKKQLANKEDTKIKSEVKQESKSSVLRDLDQDIFFASTLTENVTKGKELKNKDKSNESKNKDKSKEFALNAEKKKELFGDGSDSDWEDMDGEKPGLNPHGQEIKKLLKKNGTRVAHEPKFSREEYRTDSGPKNKSKSTASKSEQRTSNSYVIKNEESEKNVSIDPFSGIRIINPKISSSLMKSRMSGKKTIKMSDLGNRVNTSDTVGDWVTIGVVVSKTDIRKSSKDKKYVIWKMSDLKDCGKIVSFFLFGEVFDKLWKEPIGTVAGVLNPTIMPSNDKKKSQDEVCLTVDNYQKVLIMGASRDFGICKSKKKDGKPCTNYINTSTGDVCSYHVKEMFKKTASKRTELSGSYSGVQPKSFKETLVKSGQEVFYGGQSFSSETFKAPKKSGKVSLSSIIEQKKRIEDRYSKPLTAEELVKLDQKEASFKELLTKPTVGARNVRQHLENKQKEDDIKNDPKKASFIGLKPSEFIKLSQETLSIHNKKPQKKPAANMLLAQDETDSGPVESSLPSKNALPMLGRGLSSGGDIFLDFSSGKKSKTMTKDVAASIIKNSGNKIKKTDPNAVKKKITEEKREKIKKRVLEETLKSEREESEVENKEPAKKRSKILGDLDLEDEEVQKLLKAGSKHKGTVSEIQADKEERYFSELEKRETLEQKMVNTKEIKVKMYTCKQCKYRAEKLKDECKTQRHETSCSDVKKRFYECKSCKYRTNGYERMPEHGCPKCGKFTYERVGMWKERSGPKLDSENLELRGEELKFLNSIK